MDQSQTLRYVLRFESLLYVLAFTQKDFHYIVHTGLPTQGTSTEDLGNIKLGVHYSSLQQTQPLHKRQGTTTITSTLRGITTQPNSTSTITSTQEGYPQLKAKRFTTLCGLNKLQTNFSHKIKIQKI